MFLIAITISSSAALPALSPIPFIVHSTCLAPAATPAKEFATANLNHYDNELDKIALSIFGTLFFNVYIIFVNSDGIVYPTVSGIFIVFAPLLIASSTVLHI